MRHHVLTCVRDFQCRHYGKEIISQRLGLAEGDETVEKLYLKMYRVRRVVHERAGTPLNREPNASEIILAGIHRGH